MTATDTTRTAVKKAVDETPVRDEIAALEQQILYRRERIKSRSHALEYQIRKRVMSPYTLLAGVAVGFVGERMLRGQQAGRPRLSHEGYRAQPPQEKPPKEGILSQALKAVTIVQGVMASPAFAMLRRYFDEKQMTANISRPSPTQAQKQQSANGSGSAYYH